MKRALRALWLALLVAPPLALLDPVLGSAKTAAAAALLYLAGWLVLARALRRDPDGTMLLAVARSSPGVVAAVLSLAALQLVAVTVSGGTALLLSMGLLLGLGVLWLRAPDGPALASAVASGLLLLVSCAIGLALAEAAFRMPAVVARTGGNTPGMNRWAERNYDRLWERNPLHLRSLHTEIPRREDTIRILTLGDSFTWGYFVARTEDTWPSVLERTLKARGWRVEVINLGRNGASSVDELSLMDQLGWQYQPDLVILQYTLNDPIQGPYRLYFKTYPLLPGLNDFLDHHSYFYSFVNGYLGSLQMRFRYPEREAGLYREDNPGWQASRAAIDTLAAQARRRNVPTLLTVFPLFVPGSLDPRAYPFGEAHREVSEAGQRAEMAVVDLLPIFAATHRDGRSFWAIPCDPHPGVAGHRLAGEAIAEQVVQLGLIHQPR
ncbi:MAG: SGNH/GDSL hydrolase family protein [Gemmatimonadales bacterium]